MLANYKGNPHFMHIWFAWYEPSMFGWKKSPTQPQKYAHMILLSSPYVAQQHLEEAFLSFYQARHSQQDYNFLKKINKNKMHTL